MQSNTVNIKLHLIDKPNKLVMSTVNNIVFYYDRFPGMKIIINDTSIPVPNDNVHFDFFKVHYNHDKLHTGKVRWRQNIVPVPCKYYHGIDMVHSQMNSYTYRIKNISYGTVTSNIILKLLEEQRHSKLQDRKKNARKVYERIAEYALVLLYINWSWDENVVEYIKDPEYLLEYAKYFMCCVHPAKASIPEEEKDKWYMLEPINFALGRIKNFMITKLARGWDLVLRKYITNESRFSVPADLNDVASKEAFKEQFNKEHDKHSEHSSSFKGKRTQLQNKAVKLLNRRFQRKEIAAMLGISLPTLRSILKEHEIKIKCILIQMHDCSYNLQ